MALITIILSLLLDHVLRHYHEARAVTWFETYIKYVAAFIKLKASAVLLTIVLAIPLLAIAALQWTLSGVMFGLPYFIFALATLFYSLGPSCLSNEIEAYIDARRTGDDDEALHYAGSITNKKPSTAPDQQTSDVTRAILHITNDRVFAVLFWFVWLGPMGAAGYHLVANISRLDKDHKDLATLAQFVLAILAWVPARLLAIGYALSGHFDGAINAYKNRPQESNIALSNNDVLVAAGLGALQDQQATDEISGIDAARHLVMRSVLIWVAVLALLTLGGWLG